MRRCGPNADIALILGINPPSDRCHTLYTYAWSVSDHCSVKMLNFDRKTEMVGLIYIYQGSTINVLVN